MKLSQTEHIIEYEKSFEFFHFLHHVFTKLLILEDPKKLIEDPERPHYKLVPKEDHERITFGFDYQSLWAKCNDWFSSNETTLKLDKDEYYTLKKACKIAYEAWINEKDWSLHKVIKYYQDHFLIPLNKKG